METISTNFWERLLINSLLMLLLYKLYYLFINFSEAPVSYLVSFVQDSFILVLIYAIFILLWKKFLTKTSWVKSWQIIGATIFNILFISALGMCYIYTSLQMDLISFPINIFGVSLSTSSFFTEYFLSVKTVLIIVTVISIPYILSVYFPKRLPVYKYISKIFVCFFGVLLLASAIIPGINPILFSVQDQIKLMHQANKNIAALEKPVADNSNLAAFGFLNHIATTSPIISSKYDRVITLVMESINENLYTNDSKDNLLNDDSLKNNIFEYTNYHTLNLDSYTSLIAMLDGIFIPYQAYVNEDVYAFASKENSLVDIMNKNGFYTYFFTSYGDQQERFIPNINSWSGRKYADVSKEKDYSCITDTKIDYGCEDTSVLPDLMQTLKSHEKVFAYQELLYGHTAEWNQKVGMGTVEYYDVYLKKIIDELKNNNLLDKTLIILTSDHGPRDDASKVDNYHLPLLLYSNDMKAGKDNNFLSHLNFKDIVLSILSEKNVVQNTTQNGIKNKDSGSESGIYTIGNSGELVYGFINNDNSYGFISNRTHSVVSSTTDEVLMKFNKNFQQYLNYFEWLKSQNKSE